MENIEGLPEGVELSGGTRRRPVRNQLSVRYLSILHWQFLGLFLLVMGISAGFLGTGFGWTSWQMVLFLVGTVVVARVMIVPVFNILRGYMTPRTRWILSFLCSGLILITSFSLIFSGHIPDNFDDSGIIPFFDTGQSLYGGGSGNVIFQIIPYAKVYDISIPGEERFLFESHYKKEMLDPGHHDLRFVYGKKTMDISVHIDDARSCILKVNMRANKYLLVD